jgi:hypothetical protein
MTAQLVAAGVSCRGEPDHRTRHWAFDAERRLHIRPLHEPGLSNELRHALVAAPLPGAAQPLACAAFVPFVLMDDASVWLLDIHARVCWRALTKEEPLQKNEGPRLLAAGSSCGTTLWAVDPARRAWAWAASGRRAVGAAPVPGSSAILGVDVKSSTVLLADGSRYAWDCAGWAQLPGFLGEGGLVMVKVKLGTCLAGHGDAFPGDVIGLPEVEALRLLRSGTVELVPESA